MGLVGLQSRAHPQSRMLGGGVSGVECSSLPLAGASVAVAADEIAYWSSNSRSSGTARAARLRPVRQP